VLELADSNRVHLTDDHTCLVRWGQCWRTAARKAIS
jgi:hypothetical protein